MKKQLFTLIILIIPLITIGQSGISLSGSSQFNPGQSILPLMNGEFVPINYESRNNQITLSIFRGRKFKIGTFAINMNISYSINNIQYEENNEFGIPNYETIKKSLIPKLELWHIIFQKENTFIYTSIGAYGILQDLNIFSSEEEDELYEYNGIIPFVRTGLQLNYGKFFVNPFISFDLQEIHFDKFGDIWNTNLKSTIQNYTFRTGLEFGIMF